MQEVVTAPFIFFLCSILFGMGLLFLYDIVRALRSVFHHRGFFVAMEDIMYAMFAAVISFLFLCTYNYGELRGFFFLGIFTGMLGYYMKISSYVMTSAVYIFSRIDHFMKNICSHIAKPMICIQRNIKWRLKN